MRCFFLFILLCICSGFTLGQRIVRGQKGDYIVTEQDQNYSLLLIKHNTPTSILFEEVLIPSYLVKDKAFNWVEWMEKGASGHTSWVQYEIDPTTSELIEAFSFSKRGWIYLDESEHILTNLLILPLKQISKDDRKKIGPAPRADEADHRPMWHPSIIYNGQKNKLPCNAWKGIWPNDKSLLSSCKITLYFPQDTILSPFPAWIEATNGHVTISIKTIAVGSNMVSSLKESMPRRPPQILPSPQITETKVCIKVKSPAYYKKFTLHAFDLLHPEKKIGPLPLIITPSLEKQTLLLTLNRQHLDHLFTKGHLYKWILTPEDAHGIPLSFSVESEDYFHYPS